MYKITRLSLEDIKKGITGVATSRATEGIQIIDSYLRDNRPIIVGVDNGGRATYNSDHLTEHFVIISGYHTNNSGQRVYEFFDPRTQYPNRGTSPNVS